MDVLLKYQVTDGAIRGVLTSTVAGMLAAQIVTDDPDYSYLLIDSTLSEVTLQAEYFVQAGILAVKTLLAFTADPNPFDADGVTTCAVTVSPFVECTILVDGVPYVLTDEDPVLALTSDVPHVFQITLSQIAPYRADPLSVEAT